MYCIAACLLIYHVLGSTCAVTCNETNGDICPNGFHNNTVSRNSFVNDDTYPQLPTVITNLETKISDIDNNFFIIPYYSRTLSNANDNLRLFNQECSVTTCYDWSACASHAQLYPNENICCYGYWACVNATLQGKLIFCDSYQTCKQANMYASDGIYVGGYEGATKGEIHSFGSFLQCSGWGGCDYSTINNGSTLICDGYYSCYKSNISNVSHIYALGFKSLYDSQIIIGSLQSDLNVYFLGDESADGVSINCGSNTMVNITVYCENSACKSINLDYNQNCTFNFVYWK